MAAIGSSPSQYSPGPNVLVYGRDFPPNDRVAFNTALATGKNIYIPNTGSNVNLNGPIYVGGQVVYSDPVPPVQVASIGAPAGNLQAPLITGRFGGAVVVLGDPAYFDAFQSGSYVNLGTWLDSTCNASTRYGLRVFSGQQRGSFCGEGFQLGGANGVGDMWQGSTYTIAFAMLPYNGGSPTNAFTIGAQLIGFGNAGSNGNTPLPWALSIGMGFNGHTGPSFIFQWFDTTFAPRTIAWPMPATTGVIRTIIMVDVNRTQFAQNVTIYQNAGSGYVRPTFYQQDTGIAGLYFPKSFYYPFSFGYITPSFDDVWVPGHSGNQTDDWVMCGLHVENALSYKDNGSGTLVTQAGAAITDEFAFFTPRSSTAALLPLTSTGSQYPWEIEEQCQSFNGFGFFLADRTSSRFGGGVRGIAVENQMQGPMSGPNIGCGDAIAILNWCDLFIEDVAASAGASAIRSWNQGSTIYYQRYNKLQLMAAFPILGMSASIVMQDIEMHIMPNGIGVYAVGSTFNMKSMRFTTVSYGVSNLIKMDTGYGQDNPNTLFVEDLVNDNEGENWPYESLIRANDCTAVNIRNGGLGVSFPGGLAPMGSTFLALGPIGAGTPGAIKGICSIDGVAAWSVPTNASSLVRVEDPSWDVRIVNTTLNIGVHGILHDVSTGGCTSYLEQLDCGPIPPRIGHAYQGRHLVRCNPATGQYAEWRCVQSGTWGTAAIPQWIGYYPAVLPGSNACAAYAITNIGATNAGFETSFIFDSIVNGVVGLLFGGAAWTPTSVAYFAGAASLWNRAGQFLAETGSPEIQQLNAVLPQYVNGGTFTLTYNNVTTAAIPYGTLAQGAGSVTSILQGIGCNCVANDTTGNNGFITTSGPVTLTFNDNLSHPLITINYTGLTGYNTGFSFSIVQTQQGGGYARVPAPFSTAANGAASNTAAISFGTTTGVWNDGYPLALWYLVSASTGGTAVIAGTYVTPLNLVAPGVVTPNYAIGAFTIAATPASVGGFTYYASDLILNSVLNAAALTPPTTWYIGLSSTPINSSGAGLTEPATGGYARVAVANTTANWTINKFGSRTVPSSMTAGFACNTNAITFPTPTAAWSSGVSLPYWFLADAATGGNIWATGTIPVAPVVSGSTSPAPSFAPGAFVVQLI